MNYDFRVEPKYPQSLTDALDEIQNAQLIRRAEEEANAYWFKHALVQDSVYGSLMRHERKRLHRLVAEMLERMNPERLDELAPRLAEHFEEAGETARALFYLERAAENAAAQYANREALNFYARALDAAEELHTDTRDSLYRARGVVYERIGKFDEARADLENALRIARQEGDTYAEWQSLMDLGFAWTARDYARAGEYFEKALDLARAGDEPLRVAQTLNRVGNWYLNNEDPTRALAYHHEALGVFQELRDAHGIAETQDLLAMTNLLGGDLFSAREHYIEAVALFQQLGDLRGYINSLMTNYLYGASMQGETVALPPPPGDNEQGLAEILRVTRQLGWRAGECFGLWVMAEGFAAVGQYGRAFELLEDAVTIAREIDHRQWLAAGMMVLGAVEANILDFERAQIHLEQALALAHEIGSLHWIRTMSGLLASAYIAQGELARAEKILDAALPPGTPARTLGQRQSWSARVELARAQHNPARALDLLDQLLDAAFHVTPETVIPHLWTLRAHALRQMQRAADAEKYAAAAAQEAERTHQAGLEWRARAALAQAYQSQNRQSEAETQRSAAVEIVDTLARTLGAGAQREQFVMRARQMIWSA